MDKIINEIKLNSESVNKIVLSDTKTEVKKIIVKKVNIKNQILFQIERFKNNQVFHENCLLDVVLSLNFDDYKQIMIEKEKETLIFSKRKVGYAVKSNKNNVKVEINQHNKQKNYLINEGDNVPVLVDLGVFTKDFKVVKSMYDKFKQINKFIEIIDQSFNSYNKENITILDFGCGKSYLTFLVYHYFVNIKKINAKIIGYDIKTQVVEDCNEIARKYNLQNIEFILSDVKKDKLFEGKIDMIITLHVCDTATDYALDFAIKNKVPYIFSVPCCQHEVNLSIQKGGDFDILLKDGLFKERFSALLTDIIRTEILRAKGYSVDVIEFVDFAHSPKNIMLRAKLNSTQKNFEIIKELQQRYKFSQKLIELQSEN